ncbi:hypothetical protein [Vibrio breoganii]|uniref:hypothetical protein n=1 Tax=Vibrio breoganii TaxID=553239 RepID=UPI0012E9D986|nr:hypothetical protein [Vibrio breoganii]
MNMNNIKDFFLVRFSDAERSEVIEQKAFNSAKIADEQRFEDELEFDCMLRHELNLS